MMLARAPRRRRADGPAAEGAATEDAAHCDSCARRPRLALLLWILWLAVAILVGVFFGHGASAQTRRHDLLTVEVQPQRLTQRVYFVQGEPGVVSTSNNGFNAKEACRRTGWSRFAHLPAFDAANRINACDTGLPMETEALSRK